LEAQPANAAVARTRLGRVKKDPAAKTRRRLDNTAVIFPSVSSPDDPHVYRVTCILHDEVDPSLLQQALDAVLPHFAAFAVRMTRGFFWRHFEKNLGSPCVKKDDGALCVSFDLAQNDQPLFRILYLDNSISVEAFHSLTDGVGAVRFLEALSYKYCQLAYAPRLHRDHRFRLFGLEHAETSIDAYAQSTRMFKKERRAKAAKAGAAKAGAEKTIAEAAGVQTAKAREEATETAGTLTTEAKAEATEATEAAEAAEAAGVQTATENPKKASFQLKGKLLGNCTSRMQTRMIPVETLKILSKRHGVTIGVYLTAAIAYALHEEFEVPEGETLGICVPLNLRPVFGVETATNFFSSVTVNIPHRCFSSFESVLCETRDQFSQRIAREKVMKPIADTVRLQNNRFVRLVPLELKDFVLRRVYRREMRKRTTTFSNMGTFSVQEPFRPFIKGFTVIISTSSDEPMRFTACSYNGELALSCISKLKHEDILGRLLLRFQNT